MNKRQYKKWFKKVVARIGAYHQEQKEEVLKAIIRASKRDKCLNQIP